MSRGRHKKSFPCGHRGFGKFCNRCKMAEKLRDKAKHQRKGSAKRNETLIAAAKMFGDGSDPTQADLEALGVGQDEAAAILFPPRNRELDTC
jgi:hypothetical protein